MNIIYTAFIFLFVIHFILLGIVTHTLPDASPALFHPISVIIATEGECTVYINQIPCSLKKQMLFVIQERHLLSGIEMSDDFKGYHIISRWDFTRTAVGNNQPPVKEIMDLESMPFMGKADEESFAQLEDFIKQLIGFVNMQEHPYQNSLVMNGLCNVILQLWYISFARNYNESEKIQTVSHQEKLTFQFVRLLHNECKTQREVSYYAEKLCVTPVHLTRVVKQASGKTAIRWISNMLVDEAKLRLNKPGVPIQQIAEELNFSDQAAFSKFFKKNTGQSPLEYRRSQGNR